MYPFQLLVFLDANIQFPIVEPLGIKIIFYLNFALRILPGFFHSSHCGPLCNSLLFSLLVPNTSVELGQHLLAGLVVLLAFLEVKHYLALFDRVLR